MKKQVFVRVMLINKVIVKAPVISVKQLIFLSALVKAALLLNNSRGIHKPTNNKLHVSHSVVTISHRIITNNKCNLVQGFDHLLHSRFASW